jgi:hypothetical protein
LRSGNSFEEMAQSLGFATPTVYKTLHELVQTIHDPLVDAFITSAANSPLVADAAFSDCGLIVDAKVQERGRPVGVYEQTQEYFSGKHHFHCLKSQVVTNRSGLALNVVAGVRGSVHDFKLFNENLASLEAFILSHPDEPTGILGDKAYIGPIASGVVRLTTPFRRPPHGRLSQEEVHWNRLLSRKRVVVENFFGRMCAKFQIIVRRCRYEDQLYPTVFRICCALINYNIRPNGGSPLTKDDADFRRKEETRAILVYGLRDRTGETGENGANGPQVRDAQPGGESDSDEDSIPDGDGSE